MTKHPKKKKPNQTPEPTRLPGPRFRTACLRSTGAFLFEESGSPAGARGSSLTLGKQRMSLIDDTKAEEYLGKVVLLGVTYVDHEDKLIEQKQWVGTIIAFSRKEGIKIRLRDSDDPCALPPDESGIRKAPPGIYRLRSNGEEIENPDYLATWTCVSPDPKKKAPNQAPEPTALLGRGSS